MSSAADVIESSVRTLNFLRYGETRRRRILRALGNIYSLFPAGWPGLGLVLLRVSVALTSTISVAEWYHQRPDWYLLGVIPLGAALCAGFLTPLATLLAIGAQALWFTTPNGGPLCVTVTALNMLALAILGPGAYSVDALLFGRRLLMTHRDD